MQEYDAAGGILKLMVVEYQSVNMAPGHEPREIESNRYQN